MPLWFYVPKPGVDSIGMGNIKERLVLLLPAGATSVFGSKNCSAAFLKNKKALKPPLKIHSCGFRLGSAKNYNETYLENAPEPCPHFLLS